MIYSLPIRRQYGFGAKNEQRLHKTWIPNGISSYAVNPNKCGSVYAGDIEDGAYIGLFTGSVYAGDIEDGVYIGLFTGGICTGNTVDSAFGSIKLNGYS
ncbi:hypothetical protein M3Y14_29485 [Bacillus thuringiensis]|uniref:hypothetical protein n=1 Tax=Bacillus thuringiensis TaxID=1428 RepID=UPI002223F755|nr:hypothetical protein [Bacillus thuringiensis]UYX52469.1 hypothetical protein M3Y14_29485 [Bacillus thuringiensis]